LSIWNKSKRAEVRARDATDELAGEGDLLTRIYVPYGDSLIAPGDCVYIAGIEDGELMLISRVLVEEVTATNSGDSRVEIEAEAGTESEVALDRFVPRTETNRLEFLDASGTTQVIKRDGDGAALGTQFQGKASLRELVGPSAQIFDGIIGPR
jgi:hypothetical protein